MRYTLRTLLIALAVLPPILAGSWWRYSAWKAEQEHQRAYREAIEALYWPYPLVDIKERPKPTNRKDE